MVIVGSQQGASESSKAENVYSFKNEEPIKKPEQAAFSFCSGYGRHDFISCIA